VDLSIRKFEKSRVGNRGSQPVPNELELTTVPHPAKLLGKFGGCGLARHVNPDAVRIIRLRNAYPSRPTIQFSVVGALSGTIALRAFPDGSGRRLFINQSFYEQCSGPYFVSTIFRHDRK
jgi:hypothetical protein